LFDQARLVLAHQQIGEDRITRRFGKTAKTHQEETVAVFSANLDFDKEVTDAHKLFYGAELTFNDVQSNAFTEDIVIGTTTNAATRYPDGGSSLTSAALYLTWKWHIYEALDVSAGTRYSAVGLRSTFNDKTFFNFPFDKAEIHASALNGSIGFVWRPFDTWSFNVNASSGFRAPNVDDIGKLFDSSPGTLIVPNPDLKPEYASNVELGIEHHTDGGVTVGVRGFYTELTNAIVIKNYQFNGQDSVLYQGTMSRVQANVNSDEAIIYGTTLDFLADLTEDFSIASTLSYTYGRDKSNDSPLSHIPPVFGQTRFLFRADTFRGEFSIRYNAWKNVEEYSPDGEDNIQYATPLGMPSWYTLNLRASYHMTPFLNVTAALENLLDSH